MTIVRQQCPKCLGSHLGQRCPYDASPFPQSLPFCNVCGQHHAPGERCHKKFLEDVERWLRVAGPSPIIGPEPARIGWRCPGCGRCWAPHVDRCGECGA